MPDLLYSVQFRWDPQGRVNFQIADGFPTHQDNINEIIAPTLPMLLSHQLGIFRPSTGMELSARLLTLYIKERIEFLPVQSDLKSVAVNVVEEGGVYAIQMRDEAKMLSSTAGIERGIQQFLNNYACYLAGEAHGDIRTILKGFVSVVLDQYYELLEDALEMGLLSPNKDKPLPSFAMSMAETTSLIAEKYSPQYPREVEAEEVQVEVVARFSSLARRFRPLAESIVRSQKA